MATKVRTNVYLDKELKERAKELFREYGLSLSDALNIFLVQVVRRKELPLEGVIPEDTLKVIEETRKGKNMRRLTLEEFRKINDHRLKGSLGDVRDFHIGGDIVVLYRVTKDKVQLLRIGSHTQVLGM